MFIYFLDVPPVPGRPKIQNLKDTAAILEWETFLNINSDTLSEAAKCIYKLESCRLRSSESWTTVNVNVKTTKGENGEDTFSRFCTVNNLKHGETYTFRVIAIANSGGQESVIHSEPSPPSNPLTIPLGDIPSASVGSSTQGALSSRRSSTSSGSGSCSGAGSVHVCY